MPRNSLTPTPYFYYGKCIGTKNALAMFDIRKLSREDVFLGFSVLDLFGQ